MKLLTETYNEFLIEEIVNLFKKHGFKWGGEIFKGFHDAHHAEK